jgi:hypothetical protein
VTRTARWAWLTFPFERRAGGWPGIIITVDHRMYCRAGPGTRIMAAAQATGRDCGSVRVRVLDSHISGTVTVATFWNAQRPGARRPPYYVTRRAPAVAVARAGWARVEWRCRTGRGGAGAGGQPELPTEAPRRAKSNLSATIGPGERNASSGGWAGPS